MQHKSPLKKDRRQFIKNVSLATFTAGLLPSTLLASTAETRETGQTMACNPTTQDYYGVGPFYTQNPPNVVDGQLAKSTEKGKRMIISGRVTNLDCSKMIANAVVDIWHADDAGTYDNSGYNLRGKVLTNSQGFYSFETVKPGKYLNGSQYRPSHIHFKITPPGQATLITQLYFEGDTDINKDAAASIKSGTYDATHRIINLTENSEGKLEGTWDVAIEDGTMGTNELHLDKGVIYSAGPNPFTNNLTIKYGVFNAALVGLLIFDIQGKLVATLEDHTLSAEKYEAVWSPNADLPVGYYFVALKINDLQVQYIKVLRH